MICNIRAIIAKTTVATGPVSGRLGYRPLTPHLASAQWLT